MTNSVEPPPMSIRKSGSWRAGNSLRSARLIRRASSSPEMTSTRTPVRFWTASTNSSELDASRTAQVATARTTSAPEPPASLTKCSTVEAPASMASGESFPVRRVSLPRRTIAFSRRSTSSVPSSSRLATSSLMLLVPMSIARERPHGGRIVTRRPAEPREDDVKGA